MSLRNASSQPPASWKGGGATPQRARGLAAQWRREVTAARGAAAHARRRLLVAGVAVLFFLCLGSLLWASTWLWPLQPSCLVLVGAGYEENLALPANVQGWQGLQDLADLSSQPSRSPWWGPGWPRLQHAPKELRVGDVWDRGLDSFAENTVIVYFALNGGADAEGAYLLPQDADARPTPENRLRVEQIVARLAQLPAHKNKLLLLDATRIQAYWPLGMIQNDFARELDKLGPRIVAVPNLAVISASAADQRSWASAEWNQTAFAHFMIEGLKGAAGDRGQDARVNGLELYRYVRANVENWAWSNRQAVQTPVLLPRGAEGERRVKQMSLSVTRNHVPADPRQLPAFTPPPDLLLAWQKYQTLASQEPPPQAYTPALWRLYRDTLLRYEQLVCGGGSANAITRLSARLIDLEQAIVKGRRVDLNSLQNTLFLPATAGISTGGPTTQARRDFNELWNAPMPEQAAVWAKLTKGVPDRLDRDVLRLRFYDMLLDRAAEDPTVNVPPGTNLLRLLTDPVAPRPVEAQYLALLIRDMPTPRPPADLIRTSLRSMHAAGQTALSAQFGVYPYSEEVYPWLRSRVEAGDAQRRLAQDLVFASDEASWDKARGLFRQANEQYDLARTDGTAVRAALATRDRILAQLPYYSRWLAQRRQTDSKEQQAAADAVLRDVEQLWQDAHQLAAQLASADPAAIAKAPPGKGEWPVPRGLTAQADVVRQGFERLTQRFLQTTLSLTDANLQVVWRDIDDVLQVPDIDSLLRVQLIANQRRISRQLLIETGPNPEKVPALSQQRYRDRQKEHARTQGRLAIAILGTRWFNEVAGADHENYTQARHRLDTFVVEENWWESLAKVGEQVGACWRQMPVEINRLVQLARTAERPAAMSALRDADRLARVVDGGDSLRILGHPAEEYRHRGLQSLLLWLGQRTWDDHWFAEDPTTDPYYRVAGLLYANDAARFDPRPKERQTEVLALQRRLMQAGGLTILGAARQSFTSEQRFGLDYRVAPAEGAEVPPGFPVVRVEPGKFLEVTDPAAGPRLPREIGAAAAAAGLKVQMRSPVLLEAEAKPPRVPRPESTTLSIHGLYRGQRLQRDTRIELYPLADVITYRQPLPEQGSVAVRADEATISRYGASNGAIAIVLDCSGSMGPPTGEVYGPATKYAEALSALRQVLRRLPKGTTVSLWTFGQAMGPRKTVPDAERTVQRLLAPVKWDPEEPAQLRDLMAKVAYPTLEPWNESPVVRAMVMAKDDLKKATGFKTLLVLTDGMDNRFATDQELNPNKIDIPTFLTQTFRDSGIVVNMVGYKVVNAEMKRAEQQFKVIEKLPLPGKWVTVSESKELAGILERAMRQQLRYFVDREDNVPLPNQNGGTEVSLLGANDQWFPHGLKPRGYKVRVLTDRRLEKDIAIRPADLLLVDLLTRDGKVVYERGLFSRSDFSWKPAQDRSGWLLAVLQNQAVEDGGLEMLLTLERLPDARESMLEMLKPRRVWIEVAPPTNRSTPFSQRWGYRAGYPAPAWALDVPAWPTDGGAPARPLARVWWNPDQETTPAASLDRGADFRKTSELVNRTVPVDGADVRIEGVDVEDHLIEVRPGVKEKQSCLVVRLRHTEGKPVWADLRGLTPAGEEHRLYSQANSYTGLFWPVPKEALAETLSGLRVYSLPAFQRDAERRGYSIEMRDLKSPEASDVRPRPLLFK